MPGDGKARQDVLNGAGVYNPIKKLQASTCLMGDPLEQAHAQFGSKELLDLLLVVATFAAVLVALFGDWLRAKIPFLIPQLEIQLLSRYGTLTSVDLKSGDQLRPEKARYYHIRVSNRRRWSPVSQVQVVLLSVQMPGPDGEWQTKWNSEVPLQWSFPQIRPLTTIVGHSVDCDLCVVVKEKWLELTPLAIPNGLQDFVKHRGATNLIVTIQARGTEADSPPLRLRLAWNGKWADGEKEMAENCWIAQLD